MKRKKVTEAERKRRSEAASMLGRLGASKGGRTRMSAMTETQRLAFASSGGEGFARLSKRKRRESARKGWATRRRSESETERPSA